MYNVHNMIWFCKCLVGKGEVVNNSLVNRDQGYILVVR